MIKNILHTIWVVIATAMLWIHFLRFLIFTGVCVGVYNEYLSPWWIVSVSILILMLGSVWFESKVSFVQGLILAILTAVFVFASISPWWAVLVSVMFLTARAISNSIQNKKPNYSPHPDYHRVKVQLQKEILVKLLKK